MVLKTCGTTKLLSCVPHMCELAAGLGLEPARVKYTRASYLFPDQQPAPHTSFDAECGALRATFAPLGASSAYVLGDGLNGLQWHVFVAGALLLLPLLPPPPPRPLSTPGAAPAPAATRPRSLS